MQVLFCGEEFPGAFEFTCEATEGMSDVEVICFRDATSALAVCVWTYWLLASAGTLSKLFKLAQILFSQLCE